MAVLRVAKRVAEGGHDVPDDVVRRRYVSGLRNLFRMYSPAGRFLVALRLLAFARRL